MESQQKTLHNFVKSRKRPTSEDVISKKEKVNNVFGINKPTRKLSFDGSAEQCIKKQKVS